MCDSNILKHPIENVDNYSAIYSTREELLYEIDYNIIGTGYTNITKLRYALSRAGNLITDAYATRNWERIKDSNDIFKRVYYIIEPFKEYDIETILKVQLKQLKSDLVLEFKASNNDLSYNEVIKNYTILDKIDVTISISEKEFATRQFNIAEKTQILSFIETAGKCAYLKVKNDVNINLRAIDKLLTGVLRSGYLSDTSKLDGLIQNAESRYLQSHTNNFVICETCSNKVYYTRRNRVYRALENKKPVVGVLMEMYLPKMIDGKCKEDKENPIKFCLSCVDKMAEKYRTTQVIGTSLRGAMKEVTSGDLGISKSACKELYTKFRETELDRMMVDMSNVLLVQLIRNNKLEGIRVFRASDATETIPIRHAACFDVDIENLKGVFRTNKLPFILLTETEYGTCSTNWEENQNVKIPVYNNRTVNSKLSILFSHLEKNIIIGAEYMIKSGKIYNTEKDVPYNIAENIFNPAELMNESELLDSFLKLDYFIENLHYAEDWAENPRYLRNLMRRCYVTPMTEEQGVMTSIIVGIDEKHIDTVRNYENTGENLQIHNYCMNGDILINVCKDDITTIRKFSYTNWKKIIDFIKVANIGVFKKLGKDKEIDNLSKQLNSTLDGLYEISDEDLEAFASDGDSDEEVFEDNIPVDTSESDDDEDVFDSDGFPPFEDNDSSDEIPIPSVETKAVNTDKSDNKEEDDDIPLFEDEDEIPLFEDEDSESGNPAVPTSTDENTEVISSTEGFISDDELDNEIIDEIVSEIEGGNKNSEDNGDEDFEGFDTDDEELQDAIVPKDLDMDTLLALFNSGEISINNELCSTLIKEFSNSAWSPASSGKTALYQLVDGKEVLGVRVMKIFDLANSSYGIGCFDVGLAKIVYTENLLELALVEEDGVLKTEWDREGIQIPESENKIVVKNVKQLYTHLKNHNMLWLE